MSGECNHCGGEHSCDEMAWCSEQVVSAIRAHARAMVAGRLWAQAEAGTDVNHVVADADALLAALSASSGGEHSGAEQSAVPVTPDASNELTATPPLSADAVADAYGLNEHETVTVRRDDLRMLLERHGSPRFPHAPEWLFRIREAVSR